MVKIVRHCQPRGTETDRLNLNYSRHCSTRLAANNVVELVGESPTLTIVRSGQVVISGI